MSTLTTSEVAAEDTAIKTKAPHYPKKRLHAIVGTRKAHQQGNYAENMNINFKMGIGILVQPWHREEWFHMWKVLGQHSQFPSGPRLAKWNRMQTIR